MSDKGRELGGFELNGTCLEYRDKLVTDNGLGRSPLATLMDTSSSYSSSWALIIAFVPEEGVEVDSAIELLLGKSVVDMPRVRT